MIVHDKVAQVERRERFLIADAIYGRISFAIAHMLTKALELIYERLDCISFNSSLSTLNCQFFEIKLF